MTDLLETPEKAKTKVAERNPETVPVDEIVDRIAARTGESRALVRRVLRSTALEILYSLKNGVPVWIPDFGVFKLKYRKSTNRTMPNGQLVESPAYYYAKLDFAPIFKRVLKRVG